MVRRLPFSLTEEAFLAATAPLAISAGLGERGTTWDLLYYTPGKLSKKRGKVTAVAYLRIDRLDGLDVDAAIAKLRAGALSTPEFSGGGMSDGAGGTLPVTLELAPYGKAFKTRPRRDVRTGTVHRDHDFRSFCAHLEAPVERLPGAEAYLEQKEAAAKDGQDTKPFNPLIDYIRQERARRLAEKTARRPLGERSAAAGTTGRVSGYGSSISSSSSERARAAADSSPVATRRADRESPSRSYASSKRISASPAAAAAVAAAARDREPAAASATSAPAVAAAAAVAAPATAAAAEAKASERPPSRKTASTGANGMPSRGARPREPQKERSKPGRHEPKAPPPPPPPPTSAAVADAPSAPPRDSAGPNEASQERDKPSPGPKTGAKARAERDGKPSPGRGTAAAAAAAARQDQPAAEDRGSARRPQ
ncbi:unnamed protein product, partial [Phaeothamnion confervicola]